MHRRAYGRSTIYFELFDRWDGGPMTMFCSLCRGARICSYATGSGVSIVWSTTTRTRVSDSTAVTFSVKCFNPLKLNRLSENIFRQRFALYFFINSRAFNKYWPPAVNLIAVTAVLLMSWLYRCWQRIFNEQTNYFQILDVPFRQLYCLKFSLQSVDNFKSYARKQKWVFFSEHSVDAKVQKWPIHVYCWKDAGVVETRKGPWSAQYSTAANMRRRQLSQS